MGCDGGTIPKRTDLVKNKKKKKEGNKEEIARIFPIEFSGYGQNL